MAFSPFNPQDILKVGEALDIAEDKTGDYFKFSGEQWKRHRYNVKTLSELDHHEIAPEAFALLEKIAGVSGSLEPPKRGRDFYLICLQDHQILKALRRDRELVLLPLLVYVFTHELVHIIRFCNFYQRFEVGGKDREREERIVHTTTYEILKDLAIGKMSYILESYESHRICDLALC